jgi:hypothetical protein
MTNRQKAKHLKDLLAIYDEDARIIRNQDSESQKWFSEILPLLTFNAAYHQSAQQSTSILVQHGFSSGLYQKHEANFLMIVRQAIGELSEGLDHINEQNQWNVENFWEDLHPTVVEQRCRHFLYLASLLFHVYTESVKPEPVALSNVANAPR